jgi:DNA primase
VFDLDPGEGATIVDCARVAERLRTILVVDGLTPWVKTSGSKGMQLYAGISTTSSQAPSRYAKALAEKLTRETSQLVTAKMTKALRAGKVFIDWSQNNVAKTTIAVENVQQQRCVVSGQPTRRPWPAVGSHAHIHSGRRRPAARSPASSSLMT